MNTEKLIDRLMDLKEDNESFPVIWGKYKDMITNTVKTWAAEEMVDYDKKVARLEAKVFAYEAILRNSNFAMAVIPKHEPIDNWGCYT